MLLVGSRIESVPPSAWTESGQTPALPKVSSSRLSTALMACPVRVDRRRLWRPLALLLGDWDLALEMLPLSA